MIIPYENFYADVESALKGFTSFRRTNPETWIAWRNTAPNGAVVQAKLYGKKTIQRLEVIRDGNVTRFPSLWDAKVGEINRFMREALEMAYGITS